MPVSDPIAAIIQCIKLNSSISALVSDRVYGEELPRSLVQTAEQNGADSIAKCIVVSSATGGYGLGQRSTIGVVPFRIDLRCYGENFYEARKIYLTVASVLKRVIGENFNGVRLYRLIPEIAGMAARDPDTNWPFVYSSFDVWAAEFTAP